MTPTIPFGKHADTPLSDIPLQYLRWFADWYETEYDDPDEELLKAVRFEIKWRDDRKRPRSKQRQQESSSPAPKRRIPSGVTEQHCCAIISAGRKSLALKHHPDRGGSLSIMQSVNASADWLEQHLGEVFTR